MADFSGRTVIVAGGAGTLGRAISLAFARAGANVVVNDLGCSTEGEGSSTEPAEAVVEEIRQITGGPERVLACSESVLQADKIIDATISKFGRVDAIINAVGMLYYGPFEEQSQSVLEKTFQTNTLGPILLIQRAWALFKKQRYGRVVNFASDSIYGMPNSSAYVMTKGALLGLNKSLALEGAPFGITVNCVGPCAYGRQNERNFADLPPEQRQGFKEAYTPESNVAMILALAHPSNTFTGECFSVGNFRVDRTILGITGGAKNIRTLEDCLEHTKEIYQKGSQIHELSSVVDLLVFKQL